MAKKEYEKTCAVCGRTFTALAPNAKYCSDACRKEAEKTRRAAKIRERGAESTAPADGKAKEISVSAVRSGAVAPILITGDLLRKEEDHPDDPADTQDLCPQSTERSAQDSRTTRKRAEPVPVTKRHIEGFRAPLGKETRHIRRRARRELNGRITLWATVISSGAGVAVAAAWERIVYGYGASAVVTVAVMLAVMVAGAIQLVTNIGYKRKIKIGKFTIVHCHAIKQYGATGPDFPDILIETEYGQTLKTPLAVDMRPCHSSLGRLILVKCVFANRPTYILLPAAFRTKEA